MESIYIYSLYVPNLSNSISWCFHTSFPPLPQTATTLQYYLPIHISLIIRVRLFAPLVQLAVCYLYPAAIRSVWYLHPWYKYQCMLFAPLCIYSTLAYIYTQLSILLMYYTFLEYYRPDILTLTITNPTPVA